MTDEIIGVKNLSKEFHFPVKDKDSGFLKNFFRPGKKIIKAVDDISFSVEKGEALAFIGPNGAGKSTTIKMLTGILYPNSGEILVAGMNPQKRRKALSYRIGTVFGQRSQLIPNLPVRDSLRLFGKIYEMKSKDIELRISELILLLDLEEIIDQPVRKLSLGQRMRSEIAASLIHSPEIIFLDEPTIGLDVVAKNNLRESLLKLNQSKGTTLFLTSHDVGDIEALAERTIIINNGKVIVDDKTEDIKKEYLTKKYIELVFTREQNVGEIAQAMKKPGIMISKLASKSVELEIDLKKLSLNNVIRDFLEELEIDDINVEDISLEEIIREIYTK